MKKFQSFLFLLGLLGVAFVMQPTALAANLADESCRASGSTICNGGGDLKSLTKTLIDTLLYILGAIAVIVIIVGGLRYITSDGDPGKIKSAKDLILYAVIGLIVAILSYAIVNFVLDRLK